MKIETYKKIIQKGSISDELEFEKALILERKLRLLSVDNPDYKEDRLKLRQLIKDYEKNNWSSVSEITDEKIKESDNAELIAEQERIFVLKRKQIIKEKLTNLGLNQQELGSILGHNKTYMSELMNGINPFTIKDLIIIHRLFKIKLENLIPTTISHKERGRIKLSILKINKPKLKLDNMA
ncbi:MAG: transcriptional regulator [Bacteroidetes bacterium HGW-Bacteroidetes-23]|nr:MAG: transcriptional regulator [Bacteroidetes bacterium HGW-Bacteroidetes-23]